MNPQTLTESAALRALGLLEGDELRRFESELRDNPSARSALDHFESAARQSAFFPASGSSPSPAGAELPPESPKPALSPAPFPWLRWLPWGLAACLAVACALLWLARAGHADAQADADLEATAQVQVAARAADGGF